MGKELKTSKSEPVYSFQTKSRCPRCGATDTKATGSHGGVQSRECQRPVCRWKYKVSGTVV